MQINFIRDILSVEQESGKMDEMDCVSNGPVAFTVFMIAMMIPVIMMGIVIYIRFFA